MTEPEWTTIGRPGYFGRRRDEKIAAYNKTYGVDNWRLVWLVDNQPYDFVTACKLFYEESYYRWFAAHLDAVDHVCRFGECIDNAPTNVQSGLDYMKQESFSTHIQDIAVRNVLHRMDRKFAGTGILTIRSQDSNGWQYGPGNIPFYDRKLITQPEVCPSWAKSGSVEAFWQSNKNLQVRAA